jgi:leader peptidase (prepilin peptidase)/N-methyltransferase
MNCLVALGAYAADFAVLTVLARNAAISLGRSLPLGHAAYWLASCAAAACAVGYARHAGAMVSVRVACVFATAAICSWTDLECGLIFDRVLCFAGLVLVAQTVFSQNVVSAAEGAAVGTAAPLALHFATRGRALGFGDVKLAAFLGAACNVLCALRMLDVACIAGAIAGGILLATQERRRGDTIPFAPFLAIGSICTLMPEGW